MKKQRNLRSMAAQAIEQVVEQGQSLSNILPPLQQKVSDKDKALLQELCFGWEFSPLRLPYCVRSHS
ncbi:hypothetical protein EIMP300_18080 [Escherichia coli]|uniref:Uncharacterized protein n=1 Tax=Escherichia coli TaxID=562 RepID=A0A8S0FJT9_ECOLX|nr:hypothetical protein EIMP300_18080 [Escherichia coli]